MKTSRHYYEALRFMRTKCPPALSRADLMDSVICINAETGDVYDLRQLSDCTEIKDVTGLDFESIILCALTEVERPESKLAILIPDSPMLHRLARTYQIYSERKRKEVNIFWNVADALHWLSSSEDEFVLLHEHVMSAVNM